jgi:oligoribonuclease
MPKSKDNLVWIDCEMTGLDPEKDVLIEIAVIITDNDLNVVEEGPCVAIHQAESKLANMDNWNKTHHSESGLLTRVRQSRIKTDDAEKEVLKFVRKHCYKGKSPLCGNSIGQDRRFLVKYMPRLNDLFHYQSIDVSSIKQLVMRWYPEDYHMRPKNGAHRALADIMESIEELKHYRDKVFRTTPSRSKND